MAEAAAAAAAGKAAGAEVVALAVVEGVASPAVAVAPANLSSLARRRDSVSVNRQLTAKYPMLLVGRPWVRLHAMILANITSWLLQHIVW